MGELSPKTFSQKLQCRHLSCLPRSNRSAWSAHSEKRQAWRVRSREDLQGGLANAAKGKKATKTTLSFLGLFALGPLTGKHVTIAFSNAIVTSPGDGNVAWRQDGLIPCMQITCRHCNIELASYLPRRDSCARDNGAKLPILREVRQMKKASKSHQNHRKPQQMDEHGTPPPPADPLTRKFRRVGISAVAAALSIRQRIKKTAAVAK